jgi:predicted AlkP superfamily phosphohydrolase/phosphomutase/tetratricopeptide (TPR) repeat protein
VEFSFVETSQKKMAKKVLLIGWDSADWKIINPLLDAGLMPTLNRFINEGVMGNIGTLMPALSPMLWNSIATGKLPEKHGIHGFVEPIPDGSGIRAANSTSRKCKAIWNILSQAGLRSNVVGWFASHPAEPINGACVSNHFAMPSMGQKKQWPVLPQSVHPERLIQHLSEFRVHPMEIEGEHLQQLIPRGNEIDQTSPAEQSRIDALRKNLAECGTVHAVVTWLMEKEPADFTAIYYNAIDIISHYFMPFHPPRMNGVDEKQFEIYKDVVAGVYRFHDMMLDRLLQLAGPDTTVIILSDHGFHSDHLRPAPGSLTFDDPTAWHRSHGIFCMKGPGILKDERIYGTSLLDIAPTILTLFGLPVGEDMDGKALVQAFETPPEVKRIPSWDEVPGDAGMHPADLQQDPLASQQAIKHLVELGYIEAPNADTQKSIQNVVDQLRFHLGISILHYGDPKEAVKIFEQLSSSQPDEKRYAFPLAQAYFKVNQISRTRALLESFLNKDDQSPAMQLMLGSLLQAEGQIEAALDCFKKAEKLAPTMPQLPLHFGSAYLGIRQWHKAEIAFRKFLEIDSDHAEACNGLSVALLRQNKLDEAVELSLRAVGLQHFFPAAHFQLGSVLARLNQPQRAALAFEHGLSMQPNSLVAHRYLARLYYRLGDFRKCHEHHEAISRFKEKQDAIPKSD